MTTKLVFIRHGQTDWNKERRYCGSFDVPLSAPGRLQAAKLKGKFTAGNFDRIYTSPRRRAMQTARVIFGNARIIKIKGMREINFGMLEGMRHKEILKKHPGVYTKWLKDPFRNHIPKAERLGAFKKRVVNTIAQLVRKNRGKTIAIVCHGGSIAVFVSYIKGKKDFWKYIPKSASVTVVAHMKDKFSIKQFSTPAHKIKKV